MTGLNRKLFPLALTALLPFAFQQTQTKVSQPAQQAAKPSVYETRADHDRDGIGKFYMGREIAHVMGYQGAEWLERPERKEEERPDQVVEQMNLKPADVVADVGAGTGYFSFRISRVVTQGKVFAVDIQREMMLSVVKALKPGGRVVQIEYRGEDPDVPIKRAHKMTVAQARKEMAAVGLVWKETKNFLPQQHFIVYEKPARQ